MHNAQSHSLRLSRLAPIAGAIGLLIGSGHAFAQVSARVPLDPGMIMCAQGYHVAATTAGPLGCAIDVIDGGVLFNRTEFVSMIRRLNPNVRDDQLAGVVSNYPNGIPADYARAVMNNLIPGLLPGDVEKLMGTLQPSPMPIALPPVPVAVSPRPMPLPLPPAPVDLPQPMPAPLPPVLIDGGGVVLRPMPLPMPDPVLCVEGTHPATVPGTTALSCVPNATTTAPGTYSTSDVTKMLHRLNPSLSDDRLSSLVANYPAGVPLDYFRFLLLNAVPGLWKSDVEKLIGTLVPAPVIETLLPPNPVGGFTQNNCPAHSDFVVTSSGVPYCQDVTGNMFPPSAFVNTPVAPLPVDFKCPAGSAPNPYNIRSVASSSAQPMCMPLPVPPIAVDDPDVPVNGPVKCAPGFVPGDATTNHAATFCVPGTDYPGTKPVIGPLPFTPGPGFVGPVKPIKPMPCEGIVACTTPVIPATDDVIDLSQQIKRMPCDGMMTTNSVGIVRCDMPLPPVPVETKVYDAPISLAPPVYSSSTYPNGMDQMAPPKPIVDLNAPGVRQPAVAAPNTPVPSGLFMPSLYKKFESEIAPLPPNPTSTSPALPALPGTAAGASGPNGSAPLIRCATGFRASTIGSSCVPDVNPSFRPDPVIDYAPPGTQLK